MPFITTDRVKEIRNEIKKEFPQYKFSVRREHHSSVYIIIKSGPVQLLTVNPERGYESVNHFYVQDHYAETPQVRDIIQKVVDIARKGQHEQFFDGDYGSVPNYYVNVHIGEWGKHYEVTK